MKNIIIIILAVFLLASCDEPTVLDLRQTPSIIVIEAVITDHPGYQYVKVSQSVDFYSTGKTPRVTTATVRVTDNTGEEIVFVHNPNNHPDSTGFYLPPADFLGIIGRTYTLQVNANDEVYSATDKLMPVTTLDSLKYGINQSQQDDPNEDGKIYEVVMFAIEPRDQDDYYLFKFYRNDEITYFNNTDIYYSDDQLLAERIDGFPSPVYFGLGDKATVEMYSITRAGYVYFNDLFTVLNNDGGGMFGPIPASPRTNLTNGALGFFQVSAISKLDIVIEE